MRVPTSRTRRAGRARSQRAGRGGGGRGGGGAVGGSGGVGGDGGKGGRADDVRGGGGLQEAFGDVAFAAFLDEVDEAVLFEGAQVVVDLLPGQADLSGERAGGAGHDQLGEQAAADRVEGDLGGGRVF